MCASLIVVMIIERMRIIIAEYINISIGALIGEHVDLMMTINREKNMSIKDKLEAAEYVCSRCSMSLSLACAIPAGNTVAFVHPIEDRFATCKNLRQRVQNIEDKLEHNYND